MTCRTPRPRRVPTTKWREATRAPTARTSKPRRWVLAPRATLCRGTRRRRRASYVTVAPTSSPRAPAYGPAKLVTSTSATAASPHRPKAGPLPKTCPPAAASPNLTTYGRRQPRPTLPLTSSRRFSSRRASRSRSSENSSLSRRWAFPATRRSGPSRARSGTWRRPWRRSSPGASTTSPPRVRPRRSGTPCPRQRRCRRPRRCRRGRRRRRRQGLRPRRRRRLLWQGRLQHI
mmetsp:Transcript_48574/g.123197  ORF Transcript_48574/g.123197 Transcript_48574/m.123197 type:complete len:232 (-) Transcript_48574:195-890(-)